MPANPLTSFWTRFVTADGPGWTAARLTLALGLSVLFFPFGLAVVVGLWAVGLPGGPQLPQQLGGPKNHDTHLHARLVWLFGLSLAIPAIVGGSVYALDQMQMKALSSGALALAGLSLFPSSLQGWMQIYASSDFSRGIQFVTTALAMSTVPSIILAELMRKLTLVPRILAGYEKIHKRKVFPIASTLLAFLGCVAAPVTYFMASPIVASGAGVVNVETRLFRYFMPFTFAAWGFLIGAFILWSLIVMMRPIVHFTSTLSED